MYLTANEVDMWVFHKTDEVPKYLLLYTSQEKADRWFNGGRFWQILGGPIEETESVPDGLVRLAASRSLYPKAIWAAEHTYIIYNIRRHRMELLPVFAAQVDGPKDIPLTWEHSELGWYTAEECFERLHFRGLKDGLQFVREYVSEIPHPAEQLRVI